jgi:electron transfer flavoprotein alpha subunit
MKTLTIALQKDGQLISTSFELIEAVKALGGELLTAVLAEDAKSLAEQLASRGGGKVLAVSDSALKYYNDDNYVKVISALIAKHSPDLVLGPATFYGKALFARLAGKNGGKMVSDINGITAADGQVVMTRLSYGGSVVSEVVKNGDGTFFATLRPKIYPESKDGAGEVVEETVDASALEAKMTVMEMKVESSGAVNLSEADVIVSAGRGIKGPEHLPLVQDLAGQTGKTVNPKLYLAVGISGAIQHLVGMRTSQTIVAINKDKDAPIFNIANYGIVGDAFEIVPALTNKFKKELQG